MTFDQLQRFVALSCGNMKSSHPLYKWITGDAGTSTPSQINIAANRLVAIQPQRFPELQVTWSVGPTVAGTNSLPLPSDLLVVYDVAAAPQSTLPDWNTVKTYPLHYISPADFDLLTKDSTVSDYPRLYTRTGKVARFWPTPSASFIAYTKWYGVMKETELVNGGDEFFMNPEWHPYVGRMAVAAIEDMRGNTDLATSIRAQVLVDLGITKDIVAEEALARTNETITVVGAPSRASVYGR